VRQFSTVGIPKRYIVFVSSAQKELRQERQGLWDLMTVKDPALKVHISPRMFEFNVTGNRNSVEENWQDGVLRSDVYLGIFDRKFSQPTVDEYHLALEDKVVHKEMMIFIRKRWNCLRNRRLNDFLRRIKNLKAGHACIEYVDKDDLLSKARWFLLSYVMRMKEGCILSEQFLGPNLDLARQFSLPEKMRRALLQPFGSFMVPKGRRGVPEYYRHDWNGQKIDITWECIKDEPNVSKEIVEYYRSNYKKLYL
jgi:hypothetical protein